MSGAAEADVAIIAIKAFSDAAARTFARIYEASFPASERDDTASVLASIADGERLCHVALVGNVLVGLAVILPLRGPDVAYLEYLAVDQSHRNQGIGSAILAQLRQELTVGTHRTQGVIFEVEPPHSAEGAERDLRARRIAMYERNGAVVVTCAPAYRAPNLAEKGTLPFTLMWLPVTSAMPNLSGPLLRECVVAILTQSYELDKDDALLRDVLDGLIC